jgi:putative transcriptional regulator
MKKISAEEFDRRFEAGEDIEESLDHSKAWRPGIAALAKRAREATGLSQAAFAERFRIPLSTFQDWEQGQRVPDAAAKNYLRLIAKIPEEVARALEDAA